MNALCILAAGTGSRLQPFTNNINKGLLPIKGKAAISHIIEKVPKETNIVITVGYCASKLIDYCNSAHPDRDFTFVYIKGYNSAGNGPGLSLWQCKDYLQKPFYLCTVDCLIDEEYPSLEGNWLGVSKTNNPVSYATVSNENGIEIINKSPNGTNMAFIGLCGISSYQIFWDRLGKLLETSSELSLVFNGMDFDLIDCTWSDIGSKEGYNKARGNDHFDKSGEFIYFVNNRVIKYFDDEQKAKKRFLRGLHLGKTAPELIGVSGNFLSYKYKNGKTLYEFGFDSSFFDWCKKNLWLPLDVGEFSKSCFEFYNDKTFKRYNDYLKKKDIQSDSPAVINGISCNAIEEYLEKIDWTYLSNGTPVLFHGDLQFDNVLKTGKNYVLLDWRECFADQEIAGDIYYDLAKINGGLHVPYNQIKNNNFYFSKVNDTIELKCNKLDTEIYLEWLKDNTFDIKKIEILTALIYLNMSPLHDYPFDEFCFNLAKLKLHELR